MRETKKVNEFRSGHKKQTGLNMQAICDAKLRFIFISVKCPAGRTNDVNAYRHSRMSTLVEELPGGYFCSGDNAYVNTDHLLSPFPGNDFGSREDTFNFFLSQLRIRIEMAFARFVRRWGILWRPLQMPLRYQPRVLLCLMQLHNFCIDEKDVQPEDSYPNGKQCPPHARIRQNGLFEDRDAWRSRFRAHKVAAQGNLRDALADMLVDLGLSRPAQNKR